MGKARRFNQYDGAVKNSRDRKMESGLALHKASTFGDSQSSILIGQRGTGAGQNRDQDKLPIRGGLLLGSIGFEANTRSISTGVLDLGKTAAGADTLVKGIVFMTPESGDTDTLDRVTGKERAGQQLYLFGIQNAGASPTRTYTITHADGGVGQILCPNDTDYVLLDDECVTLIDDVTATDTWRLISTSDANGLGVGANEFADNVFRIFDDIDNTRKLAFQTGGIAAATTRTVTIQDADGTMMLIDGTGTQIVVKPTEIRDSIFSIVDDIDGTRKLAFQTGGIAASTVRTWTAQNASGTVALLDSGITQSASDAFDFNSTVDVIDNNFTIEDNIDGTRKLQFQTGGIAASTTRTWTAQNASGTVPLLDGSAGTQIFSNAIRMNGVTFDLDGNDLILDADADSKFVTNVDDLLGLNLAGAAHYSWTAAEYAVNDSDIAFSEISTPINPPANNLKVYAKDVGGVTKLHTLDSSGTENSFGLWTVIGDHEATTAESSHNFNFTAVDFDDDSHLVLIIDIASTAALALRLRLNSVTTGDYDMDGRRITGGAETLLDQNSAAFHEIASATLLSGAGKASVLVIQIGLGKAGGGDRPQVHSHASSTASTVDELLSGQLNIAQTDLTDVTVLTSTSTWILGTRMTLYKVARA